VDKIRVLKLIAEGKSTGIRRVSGLQEEVKAVEQRGFVALGRMLENSFPASG